MEVGKNYASMYEDYYADGKVDAKREIAARQSLGHIRDITGRKSYDKILDIGSGNGSVLQELERSNVCSKFSAVEISGSGIEAIQSRKLSRLTEVKSFDG